MGPNDGKPATGELRSSAQPMYITLPQSPEDGIDLVELWIALWNGKWLIMAVTFGFAVAAIAYSLSITPVYRAEVVLAPVVRSQTGGGLGDLGGLANLAGIRLNTNADNRQSLAILESKNFIAEFIREKDLLPVLFPEEWDSERQQWVSNDPELQRDIRDGVKIFVENVRSISEDTRTGLVTLTIEWTDPQTAAEWATELVNRINDRTRNHDIEESQRKLDYLNEQLGEASLVELRLAISRVIEEQISAMMLAQSQMEYAFEVIDPAVAPKQRIRPKRTIIVIVGTLLGGFVGVFMLLATFAIKRMTARAAARKSD